MDRAFQLQFCRVCKNKSFSAQKGTICGLTNDVATFEEICENFTEIQYQENKTVNPGNLTVSSTFDPKSVKGSFNAYLLTLYLSVAVAIGAGIAAIYGGSAYIGLLGLASVFVLISGISSLIILYHLWEYLIAQFKAEGLTPSIETPGKAIGFLFIPFFNFYWIFMAYGRLSADLNKLAERRYSSVPIPSGMGILVSFLMLSSAIPLIGMITGFFSAFIILPVFLSKAINSAVAIPARRIAYARSISTQKLTDISEIRNYSAFFDSKGRGINYQFGLSILIASIICRLATDMVFNGFDIFSFSIMKYYAMSVLQTSMFLFLITFLSHIIHEKVILSVTSGITEILANGLSSFFLYTMAVGFHSLDLSSHFTITSIISSFIYGIAFIVCLSFVLKHWGLRFPAILAAFFTIYLLAHGSWYLLNYFTGKMNFDFTYKTILVPLLYVVFYALAAYLGLMAYIGNSAAKEAGNSSDQALDSNLYS